MPLSSVLGASSVIKPGVCTSTTRPSVPYEGQLIYETDTDRVAAYNGSAWFYTHSSGLIFISSTTIGTGVSTVSVSNCFSSTYENYAITINSGVASATTILQMRMGSTSTGYYFGQRGLTYAGSTGDNWGANVTEWAVGLGSVNALHSFITIMNPNLAKNTQFTAQASQAVTTGSGFASGGYLADTTAYTGFTLLCSGGATLTGGTIRVYGYANS